MRKPILWCRILLGSALLLLLGCTSIPNRQATPRESINGSELSGRALAAFPLTSQLRVEFISDDGLGGYGLNASDVGILLGVLSDTGTNMRLQVERPHEWLLIVGILVGAGATYMLSGKETSQLVDILSSRFQSFSRSLRAAYPTACPTLRYGGLVVLLRDYPTPKEQEILQEALGEALGGKGALELRANLRGCPPGYW